MVEAALSAALACGLTVEAFYAATPYLTRLQIEAVTRSRRELALYTAWHAELFARLDKLPELRELMSPEDADSDGPGPALIEARAWADAWGFTFETVH